MSFDTVTFWLFFVVAWGVWRFAPFALAKVATLIASLLFYAWWNPWYLLLIGASALLDYHVGGRIDGAASQGARRRWLGVSLAANLGLLGVFKYGPFAVENAASVARMLGSDVEWRLSDWVVPVGISFYTFQTLSYSIDLYRRQIQRARSFSDFFLYVAFFPQLVAGPIVRASRLLPQFAARRKLRMPIVQTGLYFAITGLFLKVVVADNLAPAVERTFRLETLDQLSPLSVWLGASYFSFQLYADFAGYSGIAIGLAYLMGLSFPLNFRYPYISRSLGEFWTRWHISLSQWFRDYLYIPLGGNRGGTLRFYGAMLLTMVVSGLWHGAAWTFVAWGALHGVGLAVERAWPWGKAARVRARSGARPRGWEWPLAFFQIARTFLIWTVSLVFFRSSSFEMALAMLRRMFIAPFEMGAPAFSWADVENWRYGVLLLPVVLLHMGQLLHEWFGLKKHAYLRAIVAGVLLFLLLVVQRGRAHEFVYFQF